MNDHCTDPLANLQLWKKKDILIKKKIFCATCEKQGHFFEMSLDISSVCTFICRILRFIKLHVQLSQNPFCS